MLLKKQNFFVAVILVVLLVTPAFTAFAQDQDTFIVVRPQEIQSLDPARITESQSGFIIRNVYSRLVDISYDGTSVEPDLAESWEVSDDGLVYTFNLRPDVTFHDGTPLTAEDVAYSIERFMTLGEGDASTYSTFLAADGAEALDDHTVQITLMEPFPAFLQLMGIPRAASIMSKDWVEANATEEDPWALEFTNANAMGTGPYTFVEWQPNEFVRMERNDDYYGDPAPMAEVISMLNEDDTSTRLMMERGEVDVVERLPEDMIRSMEGSEGVNIVRRPSESSVFWVFNNELEPFDDVRVRQAFVATIDYDALMADLVQDGGNRMNSPVYATMKGHNPDIALPERDLELAQSLLAEAGYADGLEIELGYVDWGLLKQLAVVLQANLAEAGITANLQELSFGPFLEGIGAGETAFFPWVSEPNYPLSIAIIERFHSDMKGAGLGGNISYFDNEEYDEIVDTIRVTTDEAELTELYNRAQEILIEEAVWLLLYQEQLARIVGDWVEGYDFGVYNYLDMRDITVNR